MKTQNAILGAVLAMVAALQPVLADGPKYIYQQAKPGVRIIGSDVSLPGPATAAGALEVSHRVLAFDTAWVTGPAVSRHVTLTNKSAQPASFTYIVTEGASEFTASSGCSSLAAGASCDIQVAFTAGAAGSRTGMLKVTAATGQSTSVQLSGSGRATSVTLSTPTFADAVLPSNPDVTGVARLTNNSYQPLTVNPLVLRTAVTPAGMYTIASNTCGTTLAPEASCDVTLRVGTTVSGPRNATLRVNTGAGAMQVPLSGNVIAGTATLSQSYIDFGRKEINVTSAPQSVQLTNTGNAVLNVSSMSFVYLGEYFGRSNTCGSPLRPGESCTISIAFTPKNSEYVRGELAIVHDGNGAKNLSAYGQGAAIPDVSSYRFGDTYVMAGNAAVFYGNLEEGVTTTLSCTGAGTITKNYEYAYTIPATHEGSMTCTLRATNSVGSSEVTKTVEVIPYPEVTELTAPSQIKANQPATITWATKGAVSAYLYCNNASVTNGEGLQGTATIVAPHAELPLDCAVYAQGVKGHNNMKEVSITVVN